MMGRQNFESEITTEEIAQQIMELAKNRLTVDLRFLSKAFGRFQAKEFPEMEELMATDGKMLYYAPEKLLRAFKSQKHMPVCALLHLTLHCLLGHPFQKQEKNQELWNLASDVAVENIIRELGIPSCSLEDDPGRQEWLFLMKEYCPHMTAEELYRYFLGRGLGEAEEGKLSRLFHKDGHFLWNLEGHRQGRKNSTEKGRMLSEEEAGEETAEAVEATEAGESMERRRQSVFHREWKMIARQAEMDLKTFSRRYGQQAGSLMDELAAMTFEECDYSEFLRRFGTQNEVMQISEDEFDVIYYTYGLKKYGNIPLIEPLEFRDEKRIREFVVAIDTSGSVQGDIVQNFLRKTCDVLRQTGSFTDRVKIYLIQCDAEIQSVEELESLDGLEELISELKLVGFGGTDFRPVFDYVDRLLETRVLTNLNGLIYFTDGVGTYPEKKPDYKTAFIFNRDDYISPHVPYWAIRAVLTTDNIRLRDSGNGFQ